MTRFSDVKVGAPIESFMLKKQLKEDNFKNKVNLATGCYKNEKDSPWVFPVVRLAEKSLATDKNANKEYLPILGSEIFIGVATKLLLGDDSPALNKCFGVQTVSGTGALRIGAEFLSKCVESKIYYHSDPGWLNFSLSFSNAGFTHGHKYRYWSPKKKCLDIDGLLEDLANAPEDSVIILQVCNHNPTGCDPTHEQWMSIADIIQQNRLFPFFDCAYQGIATGNLAEDVWAVRYFASRNIEFFCAQSLGKPFGMDSERVGNLVVFLNGNSETVFAVKTQLTLIARGMYSNPPGHGSRIVTHIINNPGLCKQWKDHLQVMANKIVFMRKELRSLLEHLNTPGDWSHITSQIGCYAFTGLTERQSRYMIQRFHIYMTHSGRISVSGITAANVEYVANAIHKTVTTII